jgi:hypothetical protein
MQTMAPVRAGDCILVPPFARVAGTVDQSRRGRWFGPRGSLHLRFDSVQTAPGSWVAVSAVLASVEWGDPEGAPAPVEILVGEEAVLRLVAPLVLPQPARCANVPRLTASFGADALPPLPSRTANALGEARGDPINVLLRGERDDLEAAFASAGWVPADRPTLLHLARGVGAAILASAAPHAPVSHQYYFGRVEDHAFERAGPSARQRHHVRLWQVDPAGRVWSGAANKDIGLLVNPWRGSGTHRIDPAIDRERELLVRELLASGCARFEGYTTLSAAASSGTNLAGQPFWTDGRTAVVDLAACQAGSRGPLEGVWRRVAETYLGPDTGWTLAHPQPSLYIFTARHYSMMFVPGTAPRAPFTTGAPTGPEKLAAFESFRASAGTYEVKDSTLTLAPVVARVPNRVGESQVYAYRVRGDSLWLTMRYPWARDPAKTAMVQLRLVRAE